MGQRKRRAGEMRGGGVSVFDRLFANLAPRVQAHLLALTGGDRAEAEDLTQETFLAAYANHARYEGRSQPLTWLIGIARRRWRDAQRGVRLEQVALSEETRSPDACVEEDVVRAAELERCLALLDPRGREAVLLFLGHGLTYAEAAIAMSEPVGTVKWRVHEATRSLRQSLRSNED